MLALAMKQVHVLYDFDSPILLHVCCAPCASSSLERLLENNSSVTLFYSNSNIFPHDEFLKRKSYVETLAEHYSVSVICDEWDHEAWLKAISGLEDEPERGLRCKACFNFNLNRTHLKSLELGFRQFTTTLTVSPHKDSSVIFEQGDAYEGFFRENFKKRDGFRRSIELSRVLGLYRQDYCGCEFSMRDKS